MAKILSIDYGLKRVGLAATDELQIIASALETVPTEEIFNYLTIYFQKNKVEEVIIGLPKDLLNRDTHGTQPVLDFIEKYKKQFDIPISTIDERFTSKMASQTIAQSGLKKKKRQEKGLIDQISAVIMLQEYLERK